MLFPLLAKIIYNKTKIDNFIHCIMEYFLSDRCRISHFINFYTFYACVSTLKKWEQFYICIFVLTIQRQRRSQTTSMKNGNLQYVSFDFGQFWAHLGIISIFSANVTHRKKSAQVNRHWNKMQIILNISNAKRYEKFCVQHMK